MAKNLLKNEEEVVLFNNDSKDIPIPLKREDEPLVMFRKSSQRNTMPASQASPILFQAKGCWPFDLFQDELIIEEKRLIIKRKHFPLITTITTIPLSKLTNFEITHSIFFSSIYIKGAMIHETTFQWLHKADAQEAKDLMDGIRMRDNESIVVLEQDRKRMIRTLELMGHT